jgi:hypothetical protein
VEYYARKDRLSTMNEVVRTTHLKSDGCEMVSTQYEVSSTQYYSGGTQYQASSTSSDQESTPSKSNSTQTEEVSTQSENAYVDFVGSICPNCGARLEGRKCKLLCPTRGCGYMVTCSEW